MIGNDFHYHEFANLRMRKLPVFLSVHFVRKFENYVCGGSKIFRGVSMLVLL